MYLEFSIPFHSTGILHSQSRRLFDLVFDFVEFHLSIVAEVQSVVFAHTFDDSTFIWQELQITTGDVLNVLLLIYKKSLDILAN